MLRETQQHVQKPKQDRVNRREELGLAFLGDEDISAIKEQKRASDSKSKSRSREGHSRLNANEGGWDDEENDEVAKVATFEDSLKRPASNIQNIVS